MVRYAIHVFYKTSDEQWLILAVLLVITTAGYWGYLYFKKADVRLSAGRKWRMLYGVLVYTSVLLWSTLFLRSPGTTHQANLIPLWSWYQGFLQSNDEIRWQIYFNILLFVPFGCLIYLSKPKSLSKVLLKGVMLSMVIELCQLVFKLGLCEWDDLIHNSLGCLLGGSIAKMIERVWNLHRLHKTSGRKL